MTKGCSSPSPTTLRQPPHHPPTILPPSSSFSFPPNPSAWENSPPCPSLRAFIFFQGAALQRRICSQQGEGQRAPCKELPGHRQGSNCNLEILYKHTPKNSPLLVPPGFAAAARHACTHPAPRVRWPDLARRRCAPGIPLQPCPARSRAPPASPCPPSRDPPVFQREPLRLGGGCGLGARRREGGSVPGVAMPCGCGSRGAVASERGRGQGHGCLCAGGCRSRFDTGVFGEASFVMLPRLGGTHTPTHWDRSPPSALLCGACGSALLREGGFGGGFVG